MRRLREFFHKFLPDLWREQHKESYGLPVMVVVKRPNGHIAFGLGPDAPTIDPAEVCDCGECPKCRFTEAMIAGLLKRFPKFREWVAKQPDVFWLNYRAHYQAIAEGVLAVLTTWGDGYEVGYERDKLSVAVGSQWKGRGQRRKSQGRRGPSY